MSKQAPMCKKCINTSGCKEITINENGICSDCTDFQKQPEYDLILYRTKMEKKFAEAQNDNNAYDALVMFSGGKDSAYLIHLAQNVYKLRTIAFSCVHPFVNSLSLDNMEIVAKKLNVDLIKFFIDEQMIKTYMRAAIVGKEKFEFDHNLCYTCAIFYNVVPLKFAINTKIPFILHGRDACQVPIPTFIESESYKDQIINQKQWEKQQHMFHSVLGDAYRGGIYDPDFSEYKDMEFPDYIVPFSFLEYDDKQSVDKLSKLDILSEERTQSEDTNCDLLHFFTYIAYKRYGIHPYTRKYSNGLRIGKPASFEQRRKTEGRCLSREELQKCLEEQKDLLFSFAKDNEAEVGQLRESCPGLNELFGDDVVNYIEKMRHVIKWYPEYFDLDLHSI